MKSKKEFVSKRENFLNEIAASNIPPIFLNGHQSSDEAMGIWVTADGWFVRFSIGEVRRAKEAMQIELE